MFLKTVDPFSFSFKRTKIKTTKSISGSHVFRIENSVYVQLGFTKST